MTNMHPGFVLQLKKNQHDELVKIREEEGLSLQEQIRIAVADYIRKKRAEL
jgi:hypothetical protein